MSSSLTISMLYIDHDNPAYFNRPLQYPSSISAARYMACITENHFVWCHIEFWQVKYVLHNHNLMNSFPLP